MVHNRESRSPQREKLSADQIISRVRDGGQVKPTQLQAQKCTCGCGQPLLPRRKRSLFLQGHDAKLKSFLIRVQDGRENAKDIPAEAFEHRDHIGFLKTRRDLRALLDD